MILAKVLNQATLEYGAQDSNKLHQKLLQIRQGIQLTELLQHDTFYLTFRYNNHLQ